MAANFQKHEHLKSKKAISKLFLKGARRSNYPLTTYYLRAEEILSSSPKVAFAVPKRTFRRAVDRNRIRRRMREAYRSNKHILTNTMTHSPTVHILFLYIAKETLPFQEIESSMVEFLKYAGDKLDLQL